MSQRESALQGGVITCAQRIAAVQLCGLTAGCVILQIAAAAAGKNKISNIWWMREQGFKLFVHGTAFIVHRTHPISGAKWSWRKEFRSRLPINTQKFNKAIEAMKQNKYAPKLGESTATCIQQELVRITRREE
jgi:hypothetical protein